MSQPSIDIVMMAQSKDSLKKLKSKIQTEFNTRISLIDDIDKLRQKIYALDPDIMIFDEWALHQLERERSMLEGGNLKIFEDRVVVSPLGDSGQSDLPIRGHFQLTNFRDSEKIIDVVEAASEEIGLMTDRGKIDDRLVQRQLSVTVRFDDQSIQGWTTGINLNGCGIQLESYKTELNEGDICRVAINETDFQGFIPARGEILEVAESWNDDAEAFLRVKFTGEGFPSDQMARDVLNDLIEQQDDKSVSWS